VLELVGVRIEGDVTVVGLPSRELLGCDGGEQREQ
jgi:hypothetical protein